MTRIRPYARIAALAILCLPLFAQVGRAASLTATFRITLENGTTVDVKVEKTRSTHTATITSSTDRTPRTWTLSFDTKTITVKRDATTLFVHEKGVTSQSSTWTIAGAPYAMNALLYDQNLAGTTQLKAVRAALADDVSALDLIWRRHRIGGFIVFRESYRVASGGYAIGQIHIMPGTITIGQITLGDDGELTEEEHCVIATEEKYRNCNDPVCTAWFEFEMGCCFNPDWPDCNLGIIK